MRFWGLTVAANSGCLRWPCPPEALLRSLATRCVSEMMCSSLVSRAANRLLPNCEALTSEEKIAGSGVHG